MPFYLGPILLEFAHISLADYIRAELYLHRRQTLKTVKYSAKTRYATSITLATKARHTILETAPHNAILDTTEIIRRYLTKELKFTAECLPAIYLLMVSVSPSPTSPNFHQSFSSWFGRRLHMFLNLSA